MRSFRCSHSSKIITSRVAVWASCCENNGVIHTDLLDSLSANNLEISSAVDIIPLSQMALVSLACMTPYTN